MNLSHAKRKSATRSSGNPHARSSAYWTRWLVGLVTLLSASAALAQDPDNCLLCHRFRGLSRYEAGVDRVHVYFVNPDYMRLLNGPHARLACTDCHQRDQVSVVPHLPVTRVDCTQTCHLSQDNGIARRFSHANVANMLEHSVHPPSLLANLQFAAGPLLETAQSKCLYCHDEPVFRSNILPQAVSRITEERDLSRCDVCHSEQIPVDVAYYIRHVAARLEPARPPLEQAQVCAVCHTDQTVLATYDMPNTVASYVRSFHGKAALLGGTGTPDCLACHVSPGANAHEMLAPTDRLASVAPDNVANTCRSTKCHPGADASLSAASVHLDLPSSRGTIEFAVAAAFILLTIFSFGPSLVICLLELLQIVIGRTYAGEHRQAELVAAILAHPKGRHRLVRFTVNQRVQHWILAILFALLACTGFPMKFADRAWAHTIVNAFGGFAAVRNFHHWAGLALVTGFVIHGIYCMVTMFRNARQRRPDGRRVGVLRAGWDLPMVIRPDDLSKARLLLLYLFGLRREPPTFGRFSAKEKFEYLGVFWGTTLLGITGGMLWAQQFASHFVAGRVFNIALIAHTYEAFLAVIHVGILHIVNVIFSPHVFPLSPATITGDTPSGELADQHSEFVEEAARDLGISVPGSESHG